MIACGRSGERKGFFEMKVRGFDEMLARLI